MKNLYILTLLIFLISCSSGEPGGGTPPAGCDDGGTGACSALGQVLSWFTEAEYKKIAPLAYPGGQVGQWITYSVCHGAYNALNGSDDAKPFYTYDAFVKALKRFPNMFYDPSTNKVATLDQQKRILAAFFANVSQETNGTDTNSWDPHGMLCWAGEAIYDDTLPAPSGCGYDVAPNKYCFNGRGPLQLTWSYNYKPFSQAYFGDDRAYQDPRIVISTGEIAFASAFWYFTNYVKDHNSWRNGPKGLAQYMVSPRKFNGKKRDFAYTIFLINGGLECGPRNINNVKPAHRVTAFKVFFEEITGKAFVDNDDKLECDDMEHITDDDALASAPFWS